MNPQKREQTLIIVALICLGALAADRLLLTPLLELWEARTLQIEELEKSLSKGNLLLTRSRDLHRRWREMQRDALPQESSQAESLVLKSVDRWVQASRFKLVSLRPQWQEYEEESYRVLEYQAQGEGRIEEIVHFLYELETDPLPLKVERIELSSLQDDRKLLSLGITFSGVQFKENENENI